MTIHPNDFRLHQLRQIAALERRADHWETEAGYAMERPGHTRAEFMQEASELRLRVSRLRASIALADLAAGNLPDVHAIDREADDQERERESWHKVWRPA